MEDKILKTGTTTVGMVCKDGIILAADKKATLGGQIVSSLKEDKVLIINDNLAVTTAGVVSDIQLLIKIVKAQIKLEEIRRGKPILIKEAANLLSGLVYSNIRKMSMIMGVTGFLIGGKDDSGFYLYDLGLDGSLTEIDSYACDGSGMPFALGVLETQYKPMMSLDEGKKVVMAAVRAAMQRDTASGGGIDIVTITKDGAKKVFSEQVKTIMPE